jgi:competence protein ComFC
MIDNILNIIFPKKCIYCKKQGEGYICSSCFCLLKLKFKLMKVFNKPYNYLIYIDAYSLKTRKQIIDFKFNNKAFYAEYFIELLCRNHKLIDFLEQFDYIVPVPMNKTKKLERGYNQTELLANILSNKILVPVCDILEKPVEYKIQSSLSKKERITNVKNAFKIKKNIDIKGKNIILLDDIFTTGATAFECSKVLKYSNTNKICVLVIAKA